MANFFALNQALQGVKEPLFKLINDHVENKQIQLFKQEVLNQEQELDNMISNTTDENLKSSLINFKTMYGLDPNVKAVKSFEKGNFDAFKKQVTLASLLPDYQAMLKQQKDYKPSYSEETPSKILKYSDMPEEDRLLIEKQYPSMKGKTDSYWQLRTAIVNGEAVKEVVPSSADQYYKQVTVTNNQPIQLVTMTDPSGVQTIVPINRNTGDITGIPNITDVKLTPDETKSIVSTTQDRIINEVIDSFDIPEKDINSINAIKASLKGGDPNTFMIRLAKVYTLISTGKKYEAKGGLNPKAIYDKYAQSYDKLISDAIVKAKEQKVKKSTGVEWK